MAGRPDTLPRLEPLIAADTRDAWYRQLGIGGQLRDRLEAFLTRLLEENRALNLTAVRDPDAARVLLVAESLVVLPRLHERQPRRVADVGTGGGIPGLPLAIARPDLRFTLIDARRKKIDALRRICRALDIANVRLRWARAEQLAREKVWRERFDAVTARALAPMPETIAWTSGLLRPTGTCWLWQSQAVLDDPQTWIDRAAACRLQPVHIYHYDLPGGHGRRLLIELRKTGPLPRRLP